MGWESFLFPFILGGSIVSGVKYTASELNNPKLSALIGAFPTGLFSIYFLNNQEAWSYGYNYIIMTIILLISVIMFNVLLKVAGFSKMISWILSFLLYFVLAGLHYFT